jgi:hypothetical protein
MKTILTAMFVIAMMVIFFVPQQSFAQAPDTVYLSANPGEITGPSFNTAIMGDTIAGERVNPNRVYVLQQTGPIDTTYYITATMYTKFNLTIIGKVNPITGKLPVVAPWVNSQSSAPNIFFNPNVNHSNVTIKNIYLLCVRNDGASINGNLFNPVADSITITIDHCVIDGLLKSNVIYFNGNWDKLFVTNSEFRNFTAGGFTGAGVSWSSGTLPADSMVFVNNTFFLIQGGLTGGPGYHKYVDIEHNTCFFMNGAALGSRQITNAVVKNNVFCNVSFTGGDTLSYVKQIYSGSYIGNKLFGFDSLVSVKNPPYSLTEADRNILIRNNAYFWTSGMYPIWNSISTVTGPLVYPKWMDSLGTKMFTDKSTWPNNYATSNNNVDVGFDASLVSTTTSPMSQYIADFWATGTSLTDWSYSSYTPQTVYTGVPQNWASIQSYPVPENLAYTSTQTGSDGFALGDLNWYPSQLAQWLVTDVKQVPNLVPSKFGLSQNYPNPFNPTTNINYTVPTSGFVSLKVYNTLGQEVATLFEGFQNVGLYKLDFDASKLASGIYLYRLQTNGFTQTKKMILMK